MTDNSVRSGVLSYGMFFLVIAIAASNYVVCKLALEVITPFILISTRYLIATVILLVFVLPRWRHISTRLILRSALLGCFLSCAVIFWQFGLSTAGNIGPAAFIVSLDGLFVPVLAAVFFRDKLNLNVVIALPIAVFGLAILNLKQSMTFEASDFWFLACAVGFSLHILLTHRYAREFESVCFVWFQMLTVAIVTSVLALGFDRESYSIVALTDVAYEILYLGIVATALRFMLQNHAQKGVSAAAAGFLFVMEPVLVAFLGWLVLSEYLSQWQLFGSLLIFVAVLLGQDNLIRWLAMRWADLKKNLAEKYS